MNFMKTDYELKRSKRKTLSLTVTKDLKVSVKAPVGCPQKTIDDFVLEDYNPRLPNLRFDLAV